MSSFSPTADGFRLIFRRPSIPLAEIAWRWSIGIAAWFLGGALLIQYANSLPVNTVDRLLIGTQQPALILRALERIFHGSGFRFTQAGILLSIAITLAWIALASFGRTITLKAMIQEFGISSPAKLSPGTMLSLSWLNFFRAAVSLAAVVAGIGAALFANGIWASTHWSVSDATRFWLGLLFLVWIAWAILNWVLSAASVFAVVEVPHTLSAVSETVRWCREQFWPVIATGVWFGLAHAGASIIAIGASFTVLGVANVLGRGPTLLLEFLILMAYCAVADFLYVGRLAAYLRIARGGELATVATQTPTSFGDSGAMSSAVDQSELILSDVPLPAT